MASATDLSWASRLLLALALGGAPLAAQSRVYKDTVRPHWLDNGTQFWYRNDLPQQRQQFVFVDASRGERRAAFDHRRVAQLLSRRSGKKVDPDRLPFAGLYYSPDQPGSVLLCGSTCYRLKLNSYEMVEAFEERESLPTLAEPGAYATKTLPSRIRFVNRSASPIQLSWLNEENLPIAHSQLASGAQIDQPTFEGQYWVVEELASGAKLGVYQAIDTPAQAVVDAPPRDPRRSPDRGWVVEVRNHNLWLRGPDSERPLSDDGREGDDYAEDELCWSPDSRKVLALRSRRVPPRVPPDYPRPGQALDKPSLQLFHVDNGQHSEISDKQFPNPLALHSLRWSADSSRVTFVYQERGHQNLRLLAVDAHDSQVHCLIDEHSPTFVCDSQKYFCHWLGDSEVLWMSERSGWNHLWLYDAQGGHPKRAVTCGDWVVQRVTSVDEPRRLVYFLAGGIEPGLDPYQSLYCRASLDKDEIQVLTPGDGHHSVQSSPDGRFVLDTWSKVDRAPRTDLLNCEGDNICRLEEAMVEPGPNPKPFAAAGRDGHTEIYGVIYFPQHLDLHRKYAVVEHIYAGPQQFSTPKAFQAQESREQSLADQGLIVVQCDGMGTSGRSKAFHDPCYKNLREAGFPDRKSWIVAASRRYPQMDLGRLGIYGSSAGGANAVAALIWNHDFYKVAVSDCGDHDLLRDNLYWVEQWMGWPVGPEYRENSNLGHAQSLQGDLLLLVAEHDDKVDPACSLELAQQLREAGKDFQMVVIPGAGHCTLTRPEGWRQASDFLRQKLGGPRPR